MISRFGLTAGSVVMIDDIPTNLEPAAKLGVTTVWVRNDRWASYVAGDHIDHVTDDLAEWLARIAIE